MKRKLKIGLIVCMAICFFSLWISPLLFLLLTGLVFFACLGGVFLLIANQLLKKTNWYKNHFVFTTQFVSNAGYRDNLVRNYEIVNLGSNPARFAFFYESVIAQNWSTGTQGFDMDLEILKFFHSYVREGGYVLIPIVPFSSISSYLKLEHMPLDYMVKFAAILDSYQTMSLPKGRKALRWIKYPLLLEPKSILYLFHDTERERRKEVSEQTMESIELEMDAESWMKCWKDEFHIQNLELPLNKEMLQYRQKSVQDLQAIIDFCLERSLKPVIVIPPVSPFLSSKFTPNMREVYIYSFVKQANTRQIPFLDYWDDKRFTDINLYFNSFFLNLNGRKLFTKQVLKDLNIMDVVK